MKCCINPKLIHCDSDVVCSNCGIISDDIIEAEQTSQKSKIQICDEEMIGSAEISPPSILHSQKYRNILEGRPNPYEKKLSDVCNMLSISQTYGRRALYLFRIIMQTKKIPFGNVAFFAIWQTCKENNIQIKEQDIVDTVLTCFMLKRKIKPKKAIFTAMAVLLDSERNANLGGVADSSEIKNLTKIQSQSLRRAVIRLSVKYNSVEKVTQMLRDMGLAE